MNGKMNCHETISYFAEYTDIYKAYSHDIYRRELKCLEKQISVSMLPPRENDFLVGRKTEYPLGFSPQTYGSVGYYCHEPSLRQMMTDPELSDEERAVLEDLLLFWKDNTTTAKVKACYNREDLELITQGDHEKEIGTAFYLYRMSGAQMNPEKLLRNGVDGLIEQIRALGDSDFLNSAVAALELFRQVCLAYSRELSALAQAAESEVQKVKWEAMAANLAHIAHHKPETFWQAAQLAYLYLLLSGTFNYGRMDEYLGTYYARDLDRGVLTQEEALAIIEGLWSLIIERNNYLDGRVILGGADRKNVQDADRFALAAMEVSRRTKDVLPQLTLRCYSEMNPEVYEKALEVIGEGTTFPMLYNDDLNIPCVAEAFRVSMEEAASYVPFGCGEYVLYNKSFGTPSGVINYLQGLNTMIYGENGNALERCPDFDSFYNAYMQDLEKRIELLARQEKLEYDICAQDAPFLYFSILFDDCLQRNKPVFAGGIRYLGGTLEGYGNVNTSDSLTAIRKFVYEEKRIAPQELAEVLKNNFAGHEKIRQMLLSAPKYGNDIAEADEMAVRFHNDTCDIIRDQAEKAGLHSYLQVIINNNTNTLFGLNTGASADGRLGYTYMANANNPTGGMDKNGITAMLNSLVKLSPRHHAGSVQNMRFSKEMFGRLLPKTKGLLSAYFQNGGSQAMITVLNRGDLEKAMLHPEQYKNLIVRVGGFSARFVDLSKETQEELLSRTLY